MRYYLVIYWLIGCVFVGAGRGDHSNRCPHDLDYPLAMVDAVALVAIWPSAIGYTLERDRHPDLACRVP